MLGYLSFSSIFFSFVAGATNLKNCSSGFWVTWAEKQV